MLKYPKLDVCIYPTSVRIRMKDATTAINGLSISELVNSMTEFVYSDRMRTWLAVRKYGIYEPTTNVVSIPRYYLKDLVDYVRYFGSDVNLMKASTSVGRSVEFNVNPWWKIRPNQVAPINFLIGKDAQHHMRALPLTMGAGKSKPHSSKIKIPGGWTTHGTVKVGDKVITADGTTTEVDGVYPQGLLDIYRIKFEDGRYTDASADHLWEVYTDKIKNDTIVLTTIEILNILRSRIPVSIPLCISEKSPDVELVIDPYIYGKLINSGNESLVPIPKKYLNASTEQRYHLLYGILHNTILENSRITYSTDNYQLALDIQLLVRSLGGKCSIVYSYGYYVHIEIPNNEVLHIDTDGTSYTLSKNRLDIIHIEKLPEKQECTCISVKHPSKLYITDDYIVTHNTFSSLMAVKEIGKATIIILNGLMDQWYDTIVKGRPGKQPPVFDIDPSEICVIQGQKSLVNLIEDKSYQPSIILASLPTIRNYIQANTFPYNELLPFGQLMEEKGIGIKINDEAHQAFSAIVDIDLRSNIYHNLYLSATLTRGDKQSKKIFEKIFPSIIRYDAGEAKKYIEVIYHAYNIGPFTDASVGHKKYGYNQNKYENTILNQLDKKLAYFEIIRNYFHSYFITNKNRKKDHKCLILVSTRMMGEELQYFFTNEYPELRVGTYFGGGQLEDLVNYDLIISTSKKGSTGTDIDKLFVLINTLSIGSEVLPLQIMGRLRELKDGTTPIYIAMFNELVTAHFKHYMFCKPLYMKRAVKYTEYTRPYGD